MRPVKFFRCSPNGREATVQTQDGKAGLIAIKWWLTVVAQGRQMMSIKLDRATHCRMNC